MPYCQGRIAPHSHSLKNWTKQPSPLLFPVFGWKQLYSPHPLSLQRLQCPRQPGTSCCCFCFSWGDAGNSESHLASCREVKYSVCQFCPSGWVTEGAPCHRTMTQTSSQSSQMGPKESRELHKLSLGVLPVFRSQMASRLKRTSLLSFPPSSFVSAWVFSVDVGLGISIFSLASVGCYLKNCRIHSPENWDFQ